MLLKDYYKILGLEPGAGKPEIKQAYRRLALKYHPDKSGDDPYAKSMYLEIKEAYETLIDPAKKESYLQQRWYEQSMGKRMAGLEPDNPEVLLNKAIELNRYASTLNPYRIDREHLKGYLLELLDEKNIQVLNTFRELTINEQIGLLLLDPVGLLHLEDAREVVDRILQLKAQGNQVEKKAQHQLHQIRRQERKKNYEPWLLILVTLVLCLLIYFFAQ